tara:strand:- start:170 stop:622 length:453 start_codon:yes stop_codon:yes gene_type:complete
MAKIKRSMLKEIVKECLVEILLEGIDSESMEEELIETVQRRPRKNKINPKMASIQKRRDALDAQRVDTRNRPLVTENTINSITNDPTMKDIFADTAATTLASQGISNSTQGRRHIPADNAAAVVQENNLEDLFEGASNWATLAFADSPKK